ncbi:MAG: acyltransferase [Planctomycetes bacterium]|nr:acyltransferase [Planctomycetota bacterium]
MVPARPIANGVSTRRNPTLDFLRAAAIVLVVFCHVTTEYGLPNGLSFMQLGGVGVDLFFCLSGWLLGKQLCEEFKKTGTIELRRFWFRRWLRTLPAYYAVLLFTIAQSAVQHKTPVCWQYFVFLQNYVGPSPMAFFGVSWSLCVEEHFYLMVAPLLLLFLRNRWFTVAAPLLLLVPLASRLGAPWVEQHWGWRWNLQMTHLRYDQCAAGVLLAVVAVFAPKAWGWLCKAATVLAPIGVILIALNFYWRYARPDISDWSLPVWSFIFCMLIVLANSNDFWRTRFRVPGTRYLADRAYSIYLLHVEGIAVVARLDGWLEGGHEGGHRLPLILYLVGVWAVSLLAAEVLYRCVEKPFMQAREKFGASRSTHGTVAAVK